MIGARAARALARGNGLMYPLVEFPGSPYAESSGDIVWLGERPRTHHPRMVAIELPLPLAGPVRIETTHARPWRPPRPPIRDIGRFRARLEALCRQAWRLSPRGFGVLLVRSGLPTGERLPIPLELARPRVNALAAAYTSGSADRIVAASIALLGMGTGLTPAGDDLVGGALFGARLVAGDDASIERLCEPILAAARTRTHRLSAALLDDLAHGESYGVLHDLACAVDGELAEADASMRAALARLGALGHSSGWDMFTGVVIGALRGVPSDILSR